MTSKVVSTALRDSQGVEAADLASRLDVKAAAISGNEEPTNSSSAGSVHPSTKKEKLPKASPVTPKQEEKPGEKSLSNGVRSDDMAKTSANPQTSSKPLSISELRKLARKPSDR